jgi:hypothetical protein
MQKRMLLLLFQEVGIFVMGLIFKGGYKLSIKFSLFLESRVPRSRCLYLLLHS